MCQGPARNISSLESRTTSCAAADKAAAVVDRTVVMHEQHVVLQPSCHG